tara:strand:- start:342 stop:512 length:171 start_codon:yes stop_codon:yes gene_type:complete
MTLVKQQNDFLPTDWREALLASMEGEPLATGAIEWLLDRAQPCEAVARNEISVAQR